MAAAQTNGVDYSYTPTSVPLPKATLTASGAVGAPLSAPVAPQLASFAPPDPLNFTKDPSYQFTLNQGTNALQNSAAARGTLLTGAMAKGIQDYGQQSALQGYQQAYNNALQTYGTNTNTAETNFGNANTTFGGNLAASGQQANLSLAASGQALGAQGQAFGQAQTQYADQVGAQQYATAQQQQANQTTYDRARQAWVDAGGSGPLYGGYAQPGAPPPMSLAAPSPLPARSPTVLQPGYVTGYA